MRRTLMVLLLVTLVSSACATRQVAPVALPVIEGATPEGTGWWSARFRIARPDGAEPRWHIGTLLGGEVIAPVFERRFQDIMIWRIHRRSADDSHGHVFSFIFYGTAQGARRVYEDIAASPVLQQLRADGEVTWVGFEDTAVIRHPDIADTSDSHWDAAIRQTWPALAMGASRMWLDLVVLQAAQRADEPDLMARYRHVHEDVNKLWAAQGQHAVLHHLSAIYAYQPLLIKY